VFVLHSGNVLLHWHCTVSFIKILYCYYLLLLKKINACMNENKLNKYIIIIIIIDVVWPNLGDLFFRRPRRIVKRPEFRLEVVDCTTSGDAKKVDRTDAFVVLLDNDDLPLPSGNFVNGGNRWVKRRQRKMGTVRFFDDRLARFPATDTGKTIQ